MGGRTKGSDEKDRGARTTHRRLLFWTAETKQAVLLLTARPLRALVGKAGQCRRPNYKEANMAKKPTKPTKPSIVRRSAPKGAKKAPAPQTKTTKQDLILALLRRQDGASIDEIVAATDWQPHSARGFLFGAVKKRRGIDVISEKGTDDVRRYYIAAVKS
jgi:hypothetical protein